MRNPINSVKEYWERAKSYYNDPANNRRCKFVLIATAVLVVLFIFEINFLSMRIAISKAPAEVEKINKQVVEIKQENQKLKKSNEKLGTFEQKNEIKESWQRLKEKVENAK